MREKSDLKYYYKVRDRFSNGIHRILASARKTAKKKNLEFNLDKSWLVERIKPMKCEVTSMVLSFKTDNNTSHAAFRPSIDRINPTKGYTKDNCRIVSVMFNRCKGQNTDEEVLSMCKAYVQSKEIK